LLGTLVAQEKIFVEQISESQAYIDLERDLAAVESYSDLLFYQDLQPISEVRFLEIAAYYDLAQQVKDSNDAIRSTQRFSSALWYSSFAVGTIF
jgi:hypothetical protein